MNRGNEIRSGHLGYSIARTHQYRRCCFRYVDGMSPFEQDT